MSPKLVKRILLFMSVIGFIYQATQVSLQFFQFKTARIVSFEAETVQKPASLSVCFDPADIRIDKGKKSDLSKKVTLAQMFRQSPSPDDALKHIMYRDEDGDYFKSWDNNWRKKFRTGWYHSQGRICYIVSMNFDYKFHPEIVRTTSRETYKLLQVIFNEKFSQVKSVMITLSLLAYPYLSRQFSSISEIIHGQANRFEAYKVMDSVQLLPHPYDTRCTHASNNLTFDCRKECMIKGMKVTGFLPESEILTEPLPVPVFPVNASKSLTNFSSHIQNECRKNCTYRSMIPCLMFHSVTYTTPVNHGNESLEVIVRTSKLPSKITKAVPRMSFIDFFSFICSCFGTWFGVSFLSIESAFTWYVRRQRIDQNRVRPFSPSTGFHNGLQHMDSLTVPDQRS